MANRLTELLEKVADEKSFNQFLSALREDCESHERDCDSRSYWSCVTEGHWETRSTSSFLRSVEDWATRGDFADGVHHGEPILRRVATMLYVGRHLLSEERPYGERS
jgi:hypothetical protein